MIRLLVIEMIVENWLVISVFFNVYNFSFFLLIFFIRLAQWFPKISFALFQASSYN